VDECKSNLSQSQTNERQHFNENLDILSQNIQK